MVTVVALAVEYEEQEPLLDDRHAARSCPLSNVTLSPGTRN
jgi:hypothetical protein